MRSGGGGGGAAWLLWLQNQNPTTSLRVRSNNVRARASTVLSGLAAPLDAMREAEGEFSEVVVVSQD